MVGLSHRNSSSNEEVRGVETLPETAAASDLPAGLWQDNPTQLPPVDRGKDAWLFLTACFVMEALVWGFAFTYGVFQAYYSTHELFRDSRNTALIGTCAMVRMHNCLRARACQWESSPAN
jgi:hypothetical protein